MRWREIVFDLLIKSWNGGGGAPSSKTSGKSVVASSKKASSAMLKASSVEMRCYCLLHLVWNVEADVKGSLESGSNNNNLLRELKAMPLVPGKYPLYLEYLIDMAAMEKAEDKNSHEDIFG